MFELPLKIFQCSCKRKRKRRKNPSANIDEYSILLCKRIHKVGFTWKMIHLH